MIGRSGETEHFEEIIKEKMSQSLFVCCFQSVNNKRKIRRANVILVNFVRPDFTRITVYVLHTVESKRLDIAIVLCQNFFEMSFLFICSSRPNGKAV